MTAALAVVGLVHEVQLVTAAGPGEDRPRHFGVLATCQSVGVDEVERVIVSRRLRVGAGAAGVLPIPRARDLPGEEVSVQVCDEIRVVRKVGQVSEVEVEEVDAARASAEGVFVKLRGMATGSMIVLGVE